MKEERCETCKFWTRIADYGTCQRFPPRQIMPVEECQPTIDIYDFPETYEGCWCGEYKPASEPPSVPNG